MAGWWSNHPVSRRLLLQVYAAFFVSEETRALEGEQFLLNDEPLDFPQSYAGVLVNNRTFAKAEGGRVHVQVQARQLTLRTQDERQGKASTWITQLAHSCPIENSLFTVTSVKCKSRWVRHLFVSVYTHSFHVSPARGHLFPRRVCHFGPAFVPLAGVSVFVYSDKCQTVRLLDGSVNAAANMYQRVQ